MRHPVIDEPADHLRPEPRLRWIDLAMAQPVEAAEAPAFLGRLLDALGLPEAPLAVPANAKMLTRGAMATLLRRAAQADGLNARWKS